MTLNTSKVAWKFGKIFVTTFIGQLSVLIAAGSNITAVASVETFAISAATGALYAARNYMKHRE